MIRQTVPPFKLEKTNDLITPHAGLALSGALAMGLGLLKKPDRHPPKPGAGYDPGKHLFPLMLMQNGGGGSPEGLRPIRKDNGLRDLLKLEQMPSSEAAGDFLRRSFSNGGLEGLVFFGPTWANEPVCTKSIADFGRYFTVVTRIYFC